MPEIDSIITGFSIAASLLATCLILFSLDVVSQKILSPEQLYSKRRQEQLYQFDKEIQSSIQRIRQHVNEGQIFSAESEKSILELLSSDSDVKQLVDEIIRSKSCEAPLIVAISKDLSLPVDDLYIFLAFPQSGSSQFDELQRYNRRVQVKLAQFCKLLAGAFRKKQVAQHNLCFIADASSSLFSQILVSIIQKCNIQIPVIQEKSWMTCITLLIRRGVVNRTDAETILYALVLLEAHKQSHLVGEFNTISFTLPGQSCVPILIPILQKVFPCQRYLFGYDGCIRSVNRGLTLVSSSRPDLNIDCELPIDVMPRKFTLSVPSTPLHQKLPLLPSFLAKLNRTEAGIVESWMASLDTILSLKQDLSEREFLPFICKINYLMADDESYSTLALRNILEFLAGSSSSSINDQVIDAAKSVIKDVKSTLLHEQIQMNSIDIKMCNRIEDCVFVNKMILFGDKTLPDTVEPREKWSLKSGKKITGCACCFDNTEEGAEYDNQLGNQEFCLFVKGNKLDSDNVVIY